jgi:hypothetical protein
VPGVCQGKPAEPPFGAASSRRPSAVRKSARPVRAIGRASHTDELRVRTTIPRCGSVVGRFGHPAVG